MLIDSMARAFEDEGYWTLQAQVISTNTPSLALLSRCGFRVVGVRERLGRIGGVWHDVVLLERRSTRTGGPGLPTYECPQSAAGDKS